jgi:hypothetical protein
VTLKAFLFLFAVTMVAVVGSALIAEMLVGPGFERGIIIAVLSGLVVFPAARWAEYRGWIKGAWSPGGERRTQHEAQKALEAEAAAEAATTSKAETPNNKTAAAPDLADPRAGDPPMPGDPR